MTQPFLGEIQVFGFYFAPANWAFCNGETLALQQNTSLFALIGTTYGGNGTTTFQLPNLASRAPGGIGTGAPATTPRVAGETYGEFGHTLTVQEMPSHNHSMSVYVQRDTALRTSVPAPGSALVSPATTSPFVLGATPTTTFAPTAVTTAGGNQPHENCQPFLGLNFCIALQGTFPAFQ
jgi:microcystin-dependent protein